MTSTSVSSSIGAWNYWCDSMTSTATVTTGSDSTWNTWTTETAPSTTTTSDFNTIWIVWSSDQSGKDTITVLFAPAEPTAEEVAERERKNEKIRIKREKALQAKEKAEVTAQELLLELIGEKEMEIYRETGRIFVQGKKYDYLVQKDGMLQRIEKDKITDLCVHINTQKYPKTDNVIALKLSLENDENKILKIANNHGSKDRPEELPMAACM